MPWRNPDCHTGQLLLNNPVTFTQSAANDALVAMRFFVVTFSASSFDWCLTFNSQSFYCDVTEETTSLRSFLTGQLHLEEKLKKEVYQILFFGSKCVGVTFETILEKIENLGVTITEVDRAQFQLLYEAFCWQCRMQSHRGHTPREMSAMNIPTDLSYEEIMMATMEESFQTTTEKVGRNSPCPCGSGK